eukprot:TRINITY_DN6289_c0_g1_i1.p1 TRINITY_DN6289_c0_g1~~TRINITY_DN6289_c0_g1_i1.p1  ORF type:complete len:986 (+),score=155.18 TRINITY_DN6289_c0_g1_i1:22-2979(+)
MAQDEDIQELNSLLEELEGLEPKRPSSIPSPTQARSGRHATIVDLPIEPAVVPTKTISSVKNRLDEVKRMEKAPMGIFSTYSVTQSEEPEFTSASSTSPPYSQDTPLHTANATKGPKDLASKLRNHVELAPLMAGPPARSPNKAVASLTGGTGGTNFFKHGFSTGLKKPIETGPMQEFDWTHANRNVRLSGYMHLNSCSGIVPMKRWGHTAVCFRDVFYVYGGMTGATESGDFHQCTMDGREWEPVFVAKGSPPPPLAEHTACILLGRMLLFGGHSGGRYFNQLFAFDFDSGEWVDVPVQSKKTQLPRARSGHSSVVYGRRMYIFGGRSDRTAKSAVPQSSTNEDDTEEGATEPDPDATGITFFNDLFSFDLKAGKWRQEGAKHTKDGRAVFQPECRSGHAACVANSSMYICGGSNVFTTFEDVWEFSFESALWSRILTEKGIPRFRHQIVALPNAAVVTSGNRSQLAGRTNTGVVLLAIGGTSDDSHSLVSALDIGNATSSAVGEKRASWLTVQHRGAVPHSSIAGHSAIVHGGFLFSFGGYETQNANSDLYSALLYDDIIAEPLHITDVLATIHRQPVMYFADICVEYAIEGAPEIYAHKFVLLCRAPDLFDQLQRLEDSGGVTGLMTATLKFTDEEVAETAISSPDVLQLTLQFVYTGVVSQSKLEHEDTFHQLEDVAVRYKMAHFAQYLSLMVASFTGPYAAQGIGISPNALRRHRNESEDSLRNKAELQSGDAIVARFATLLLPPVDRERDPIAATMPPDNGADLKLGGKAMTAKEKRQLRLKKHEEAKKSREAGSLDDPLADWALAELVLDSEISAQMVYDLLVWIYTSTCPNVTPDTAIGVLKAANAWRLSGLQAVCEFILYRSILANYPHNISSVCDILALADMYRASQLKEQCVQLIVANYETVVSLPNFQSLGDALRAEVEKALVECGVLPNTNPKPTLQKPAGAYEAKAKHVFGHEADHAAALVQIAPTEVTVE